MLNVLYVDDEPLLLEIGKRFLESTPGFAVETLTSAAEALAAIPEKPYDAIVSDYQMPDMDGIGFLKAIRASGNTIPFILFTGRGREEIVIQALNEGADFYLQKGGDPKSQFAELAHKIRQAVQQRRAEQALARETVFTQAIFDSVPGILYLYDSEGKLRRWNKNHESITGYSAEELEGRYVLDWFPDPADKETIRAGIARALSEGQASAEAPLTIRSGETLPFLFTARRLVIGEKTYFTGIGIDITERRKAVEALRASEEKFRGISERSSDLIYIEDENGIITYVSPSMEKILGYMPGEVIGKAGDLFVDGEDQEKIRNGREVKQGGGRFDSFEIRVKRKDGSTAFLELQAIPIIHDGTYNGMQVIGRDVTERRKVEQELAESEERYRILVEHNMEGAFLEQDGKVVYGNKALSSIFGYTPDEIRKLPLARFIVPEEQASVMDQYLRWYNGQDVRDSYEFTGLHADGKTRLRIVISVGVGTYRNRRASIGTMRDITRERQQLDTLVESEERYRVLVEHSHDGAFLEQDRKLVYCNQALAALLGYSHDEIRNMAIADFIAPEDLPRVKEQYIRWYTGEVTLDTYEFAILQADKKTRVQVSMSVGHGMYRGRPAAIGFIRNIAREREQLDNLQESEKLYRALADNLPDYVIVHRGGQILYANRLVSEITGFSPEEITHRSIFDFIAPESRNLVLAKMRERNEGTATGWYEVKVSPRPRDTRTALVNSAEIQFGGSPAVLIVMSDITAHKELEASLRESEERFRVLTEFSPDTIMLFDRDLRHLYASPAVEKGLGIPPAAFIGKTHREMAFPEPMVRLWEESIRQVFDTDSPRETEFQIPSGEWVHWLLAPVHGPDGSVIQVLTSARIITKLKMTEETLRRANRQINLLNAITRHDILNQITIIRAYHALIEAKCSGRAPPDYFQKLKSAAETIHDQIEFTRVYEDIGAKEPVWQDAAAVISRQPVPAGIQVEIVRPLPKIFADAMLEKVFFNLLDNTARHGGSASSVRISAAETANGCVIAYEDNGNGIVAEEKEKIFERGFGKNTGLGLFLVREILAITGITIRETGVSGQGARFEILVPRGAYQFSRESAV